MANNPHFVFTNFSNGYVVEFVNLEADGSYPDSYCRSWLLLPAENLWSPVIRGFLYIIAMAYLFIGVAIGSDAFMGSIEVITSRKRTVVIWDEETAQNLKKEVLVWNETVANLTLLALGSSAPEILLATVETVGQILSGENSANEGLGFFTILGSAAFNLLIITAICIVSVPAPQLKKIRETGVFILTAIWSLLAYVWLVAVLLWITPGRIDPWEAWLTLLFFPLLVLTAYAQDNNWWIKKFKTKVGDSETQCDQERKTEDNLNNASVTTTMKGPTDAIQNGAVELERLKRRNSAFECEFFGSNGEVDDGALSDGCFSFHGQEQIEMRQGLDIGKSKKMNLNSLEQRSLPASPRPYRPFARARFRHAAISSLGGGKRVAVRRLNQIDDESVPKLLPVVGMLAGQHRIYTNANAMRYSASATVAFGSPSYSVMENAGSIEIEVLLHRRSRPKGSAIVAKTTEDGKYDEAVEYGSMSISYETREGTAKINEKFKYTAGTLVFSENTYCQKINIPIVNDDQYMPDTDFYVILKNPSGDLEVGDPSVARVTIIDDDKPGDFLFEQSQVFANMKSGELTATVLRQNGSDGIVTVSYATLDGTAQGGDDVESGTCDYKKTAGILKFKHNETSKVINIPVNKQLKAIKNFVIVLSNASQGSHLGENSATVANLNLDPDTPYPQSRVLPEDEDTWGGQFRSAMTVGGEEGEEGEIQAPSNLDFFLHFLSLPWKVFFAFVPVKTAWGGFPAFVISLLFIGIITAIIEQLGHLIGCVVGLRTAVTGITIIALGTSLPDTFASRTAALHDDHADASIGNITGSNSVNVFLGLGLPWVIKSCWHLSQNTPFLITTTNLDFAVILFDSFGLACVILLLLRRYFLGGELGGSMLTKWISGLILITLWFIYIIVISLKAYDYF